jgi:hypothetical protein
LCCRQRSVPTFFSRLSLRALKRRFSVFTDPATDRALSLEWSQEWLRQIGITDHDLVAWMQLSKAWKDYHLHGLKFVSCLFQ